jgi:hypothetical protein
MLSPIFKFLPISLWANSLKICFSAQRRRFLGGIVFLVCGLAWSQNISATIIYVKSNAVGENNGSSWQDAYLDLQNALETASIGDQIWVAQGIYTPSQPNDTGDPRDVTFKLINGVKIYGGFAGIIGSEELFSGLFQDQPVRNPNDYETILSGNIGISDSDTDNSYHVVTSNDMMTSNTLLDSFTITKGNANGGNNKDFGGGLYNSGGNPRLENLNFKDNVATQCGGGIYNFNSTDLVLKAVKLTNNIATQNGGGMCNENSSLQINSITAINNLAIDGGGIYNNNSILVLNGGYVRENKASNNGGGFYNQNTELRVTDNLNKVTIQSNQAGLNGGGIYNNSSKLTISHFSVEGNLATGNGGGLYDDATSYSSMHHTLFTGNKAANGGGWYRENSSSTLRQMTFSGNLANSYGGGIYHAAGSLVVNNSILWNNADQAGSNQSQSAQIYFEVNPPTVESPIVNYSIIQGGWSHITNFPGQNKDENPLFVSEINPLLAPQTGGDFHLTPGSPAANTGLNDLLNGMVKDFEQKTRIINDIVDMGPYEMQFPSVSKISCKHTKGCGNQSLPINDSILQFEVTFSEKVTGLDETNLQLHTKDLQADITEILSSGSHQKTYLVTVTITAVTANLATLRLDVEDNDSIINESNIPLGDIGSGNGSFTTGEIYFVDLMPPTVTIEQASQQPDPTGFSPLVFTVTFSETINGFEKADINFNGSTEKELLTATLIDNNPSYTVAVKGMVKPGLIIATIDADVVTDIAGNLNKISTSTDNQITYEPTPPVVVAIEPNLRNPSKEAMVTYLVTFSEAVTGIDITDFGLETNLIGAEVDSVTGEGQIYTVRVNTGEGEGELQLNLVDNDTIVNQLTVPLGGIEANNGNFKGGSYHIDKIAPTVEIVAVDPDPREQGVQSILIHFSEAVIDFDLADLVFTRNEGSHLLTSSQNLTSHDQLTWQLDNLFGLNNDNGDYLLVVKAADITDKVGNKVAADATETWRVSHEPFAIYASNPTPNSMLDFGETAQGSSTTVAIEVTKLGSVPLTVELDQISGHQASNFQVITPPLPLTITELGETATITVQCTPSESGLSTAEVTLKTNDPARTRVSYPLKCLGRQPPRYFSEPVPESHLDFGHLIVGQSTYQQIRVEQQGELDLQVDLVAITGSHANNFVVTAPQFPVLLTVDKPTQTIQLECTTMDEGLHTAVLQLATNDPHDPFPTYQLTCASEFSVGNYHSTPPPNQTIHLGESIVGIPITTSLVINKTGQMNLQVGLTGLTGAHSQDFHLIESAFPFEIKDETETKSLTIQCTPLATGLRQANLVLNSSDPAQPVLTYPLECIGTQPTDVAAIFNSLELNRNENSSNDSVSVSESMSYNLIPAPNTLLYFTNSPNSEPTRQTLTVNVNQGEPVQIDSWVITGSHADDFLIHSAPLPLNITNNGFAAEVQCAFSKLDQYGLHTALLEVKVSAPYPTSLFYPLVCVSEKPNSPGYDSLPSPESRLNVGENSLGNPTTIGLTVLEVGSSPLEVQTSTITGPQAADFSLSEGVAPFSLTATGTHSYSLIIQCIPSELGQRQAYLTLTTNDPDNSQVNYELVCTGLSTSQSATPTDIHLSNQAVPEGQSAVTQLVGTLTTVDPDIDEAHDYTVVADIKDIFLITNHELYLKPGVTIDFETTPNYTVIIRSTDQAGLFLDKAFTIQVIDSAEAIFSGQIQTSAGAVGSQLTIDAPEAISLIGHIQPEKKHLGNQADIIATYQWWSADDHSTLNLPIVVRKKQLLTPSLEFTLFQGNLIGLAGLFKVHLGYQINNQLLAGEIATLSVRSNRPPTDIRLSAAVVAENSSLDTPIGKLVVLDPDQGEWFKCGLIDDAGGRFKVVDNELRVANPYLLDFETARDYLITVKAVDASGEMVEKSLLITVKGEVKSNLLEKSSIDNDAAKSTPENLIISIFPKPEQVGEPANILMNYHWLPTHGEPFHWASGYAQNFDLQPQMDLLIWQGSIKGLSGKFIIEPAYLLTNGELMTQPAVRFNIKPNSIPYHLILSNNTVVETSPVGTLVGILSVEPDISDRYVHELIEDAAGRFTLIDNQIVIAAEQPLTHQQSAHSITLRTMDLQTGSELETDLVIYVIPDNT